MKRVLFFSMIPLGLTLLVGAGCGGRVVVDQTLGEAGGGGAGGTSGTGGTGQSSSAGPTSTGAGTGESGSSGGGSSCDGNGDCSMCVACSIEPGELCAPLWSKCLAIPACKTLVDCLSQCSQNKQCHQKCFQAFPQGKLIYDEALGCAVCKACTGDCADPSCPG